MTDASRTVAVVLAAGAGSRFGGRKLLAELDGRPLLDHVLEAIAAVGLAEVIVVLGPGSSELEAIATRRGARTVRNPVPERGLSSSVRVGLAAIAPGCDAALLVLGDQPRIGAATVRALLAAPLSAGREIVVPRYAGGGGGNPALLLRPAWSLATTLDGDRGFGPLIRQHPELVVEVDLPGDNPDVDTPADLARIVEAGWAARVRANRAQVERIREVPDGADFYAPVRSLFRADPTRADDPVVAVLLEHLEPGDRWLDVGAGAGRFALPIARALADSGGQVVALDASPSMLASLREIAGEHQIANVRTVEARWPRAAARDLEADRADVVLIAHVGYDIEAIGPFVDGLEAAARRTCVAVMMDRVPASAADPFWPPVHGQARETLPALPEFIELLRARGRDLEVSHVANEGRRFESREALAGFVRRQLWIDPAGPKEASFQAALDDLLVEDDDSWTIGSPAANEIGIVAWQPGTP
ncbi:MAG TPA: NTP transferase domain-containing protein [Candidatus Limnocylindrales bacterium]